MKTEKLELNQFLGTSNIPVFGVDCKGNVNAWNNKITELTGFSQDEAFGKPFIKSFVCKQKQSDARILLDNVLKGEETSNFEIDLVTKQKKILHLGINATSKVNSHGKIVGVVGIGLNITQTVQHFEAVATEAIELRHLINTANAPIFGIDTDGNINEWNEKMVEITGYSKEETMKKSLVQNLIIPKLQESVQTILMNALNGKETSCYELEFTRKCDEICYLLVSVSTRRDKNSNIIGVVCVAQDVSETWKHDRVVAATANELRQLIDTANAPIFGVDINGNINEWNEKTAEITGFSYEEAVDKPLIPTFIIPRLQASAREVMENSLRGIAISNYELEFRTKSNKVGIRR